MDAVVCVTIVKEKETIVKNRIARIKLEVSRDVKIEIRETIAGTPFQTFKLKALVLFALSSNERNAVRAIKLRIILVKIYAAIMVKVTFEIKSN